MSRQNVSIRLPGTANNDLGRDTLEKVYASCFGGEDALVRPQITCGTHALALALMSNLRAGDELLSPSASHTIRWRRSSASGRPRDRSPSTALPTVRWICLRTESLTMKGIRAAINERTHLVTIQRSKGYAPRKTLSVERIGK